jgi:hypothetical protein
MDIQKASMWDAVKAIAALALTAVIGFKIIDTPMAMTVDFPTLLSLLLALFSVALAALFYFKATDTSNTFYDNTYKFTRDIAQLLAKMESGFGERLRHLDEGYSSMRSYLESRPSDRSSEAAEKTKQKIEDEKQEVHKVIEQRNRIVKELLDRSQLQEKEKEAFADQLKQKEEELLELQKEMTRLNKQLFMERLRRRRLLADEQSGSDGIDRFTRSHVIEKIGHERLLQLSSVGIRKFFDRMIEDLPGGYISDLEKLGYFEDGLTVSGVKYLRSLVKESGA